MRQELTELMLRIMSSSCGIEQEQRCYRIALSEIYHCFEAQGAQLFIKNDDAEQYDQIAHYPKELKSRELFSSALWLEVLESDLLLPILKETPKSTHLLLPLKHEKSPLMLLCLSWTESPPPGWIRDDKLLMGFQGELGNYLPWKHVMLKIAAAKNHLQVIFDHLPDAVSVINSDYTIERVNKAFTRLFDIPFSEAIGKKCYQVVHHGTAPHPNCHMREAVSTREEIYIEAENGRRLRVISLPFLVPNGECKSLQIFQLQDDPESSQKATQSYDFLNLYNLLSRPLTVLSLMSGMITSDSKDSVNVEYLEAIRREVKTIMAILREAHVAVVCQSETMIGLTDLNHSQ